MIWIGIIRSWSSWSSNVRRSSLGWRRNGSVFRRLRSRWWCRLWVVVGWRVVVRSFCEKWSRFRRWRLRRRRRWVLWGWKTCNWSRVWCILKLGWGFRRIWSRGFFLSILNSLRLRIRFLMRKWRSEMRSF